ncbi:MAG: alpha/beta hydrolase [Burkholderiales bacterium]|nr:alpha/beta hydrolase [Burkholderiales bacterium]
MPDIDPVGAEAPTCFTLPMADGTALFVRGWTTLAAPARGVVQIVHGAAEHGGRYARLARRLNAAGWLAYADDHRGHGRTRVRSGALGDAGPDAWQRFVDDEHALQQHLAQRHPGLPLFMLGHSMGSYIAQDCAARFGAALAGLVLSGSNGVLANPEQTIALLQQLAQADPMAPSPVLAQVFASFNAPFADGRPGFEWLSRDAQEVQRYVDDPLCGFAFNNELVRDFFCGLHALWNPARQAGIPRSLPIYVIAGDQDPVGGRTAGLQVLLNTYRSLGIADVQHTFYPGARHEVLNETHRDQVEADILAWLAAHQP